MKSTKPRMKSNHFAEVGKMSEKKEFEPLDVGATERVDWRTAQGLSKYVHFDENGNAVLDKNLEVKGTTKLSGGLKPIHEYNLISGEKLVILDEKFSIGDDGFVGFGYINDNMDTIYPALFNYSLENDKVTSLYGVANGMMLELIGDQLVMSDLATTDETQPKLYNHTLTLTADKSYTLIYSSTNKLKVQSVSDLRKIMFVMATSDNVILPVCATDLSGTAVLQVTTALCKIGTANVTAVSDNVTTL